MPVIIPLERTMTQEEFIQRRDAALVKLETAADIWYQFITNPANQPVSLPGGGELTPVSALSGALEELPTELNNLLAETIETMDALPETQP